jgi:hypothetical protein
MRLPFSGIDFFHHVVHRLIRDHGGAGNHGQLRVGLARAPDAARVAAAWRRAGASAWTIGARMRSTIRGPAWIVRGPAHLRVEVGEQLEAVADEQLRGGLAEDGPRMRLGCATGTADPGLVLTWDHRLCDARGAIGLLSALPSLATGRLLRERWWQPGHRASPGIPVRAAERGKLAQGSLEHLRPHRLATLWRPAVDPGNEAAPIARCPLVLGLDATAVADKRQLAASGRFGETPYLLACLAAALEEVGGVRGDLLFPLAVDARPRQGGALLANQHAFVFLRIPAGLASRDLPAAAKQVKEAHRAWIAFGMPEKMSASLSFFPYLGERLARMQISNFHAGVAASCLVANTGASPLPATLFDAEVLAVDHAAALPGMPGLGALFHRDRRGLCCDLLAAGDAIDAVPPRQLAERLKWQLLERPFAGAP